MVGSKTKIKYFPSSLLIPLSSICIFSIGFVPLLIFIRGIQYIIPFLGIWFYLLLPFLIYAGISILLLSEMFFSGLIVRLFHIFYQPGCFKYHTREKNSLKWMIIVTVYTPIRKILEIIPTGGLKLSYLRLMGMKMGDNTLVGGVIKDPCVTTIGNHCTMGEYAIIYGHIHDFVDNTLSPKKELPIPKHGAIKSVIITIINMYSEEGSVTFKTFCAIEINGPDAFATLFEPIAKAT